MSWHKIVVLEGDGGDKLASEIIGSFERIFTKAGAPRDAALFETKLVATPRVLYFTPGAETIFGELLKAFSAVACERPTADAVTVVCANGDTDQFFK